MEATCSLLAGENSFSLFKDSVTTSRPISTTLCFLHVWLGSELCMLQGEQSWTHELITQRNYKILLLQTIRKMRIICRKGFQEMHSKFRSGKIWNEGTYQRFLYNVSACMSGNGSNSLLSLLTSTFNTRFFNNFEMPELLWHNLEEGIQRGWNLGVVLSWVTCMFLSPTTSS